MEQQTTNNTEIKGKHEAVNAELLVKLPAQTLFEYGNDYESQNQNDIVFTPELVAQKIVEHYSPNGKILDPCMGEGAFYKYLPEPKDWCEITKGKNFFDYNEQVDWIVSNPPYSNFDKWLDHSFNLAENIVYLTPVAKVFKSWGIMQRIKEYGGIAEVIFMPASRCGFPFGFPVGAFHFKRNYKGAMIINWGWSV